METHNEKSRDGSAYLAAAERAWRRTAPLREKRERNKNYTYGNQWCDIVTESSGKALSEYSALKNKGKEPLTNNLIRQLVKSVIGRFRESIAGEDGDYARNELDCRALEEFLISGCCFQRIGSDGSLSNVNPAKMFYSEMSDPLGRDCHMIGQLHDMTPEELIGRLARNDRQKAVEICREYGTAESFGHSGFYGCDDTEKLRIAEIWSLESREYYECHDRTAGRWFMVRRGRENGIGGDVEKRWTLLRTWRCRWISPQGNIVSQYDSPYPGGTHPFAFKLYPLIDGEVHSLVEDVIDQQKYVNRLITLVDHIMDTSAKGVLLFPRQSAAGRLHVGRIAPSVGTTRRCNPLPSARQLVRPSATGIGKRHQYRGIRDAQPANEAVRADFRSVGRAAGARGKRVDRTATLREPSAQRHHRHQRHTRIVQFFPLPARREDKSRRGGRSLRLKPQARGYGVMGYGSATAMRPLGAGVTLPQAALRLLGVLWSGAAPRLFAAEAVLAERSPYRAMSATLTG